MRSASWRSSSARAPTNSRSSRQATNPNGSATDRARGEASATGPGSVSRTSGPGPSGAVISDGSVLDAIRRLRLRAGTDQPEPVESVRRQAEKIWLVPDCREERAAEHLRQHGAAMGPEIELHGFRGARQVG